MLEETKTKLKASLLPVLEKWLNEVYGSDEINNQDMSYIGDNTVSIMTDSVINILQSMSDLQNYLERDGYMK